MPSSCQQADINALEAVNKGLAACPYRRRCEDADCLKTPAGKQFVIEKESCCCPPKTPVAPQ